MPLYRFVFLAAGLTLAVASASMVHAQSYAVDATGMPILNSLSSARGALYIDFNGGTVFGQPRGAYDLNGDDTTFNAAEQEDIYNAWLDVSTHFAMFDVNVTTVAPNKNKTPTGHQLVTPDYSNAAAYVGVFGSRSSAAGGAAQSSYARNRSTAITHEFGHMLGAYHQGDYDSQGNLTEEYRWADPVTNIAPIMGVDFAGKFSSWQNGFTGSSMTPQDDIAIITSTLISEYGGSYEGDGFRPDEHGNSLGSATALSLVSDNGSITASATGIIERYTDTDMFSLNWGGGDLTMSAEAVKNVAASPEYASSLGMDLMLYDSLGSLVTQDLSGSANDVEATISVTGLNAGTYYFGVESAGAYDDLGAYTLALNGTISPVDLEGDTDLDGDVDFTDFNNLANNYGTGTTWGEGDFDGDGDVDFTDFNLLANNYGLSSALGASLGAAAPVGAVAAVAAVPEPSSLAMLLGGACLLGRRRCA